MTRKREEEEGRNGPPTSMFAVGEGPKKGPKRANRKSLGTRVQPRGGRRELGLKNSLLRPKTSRIRFGAKKKPAWGPKKSPRGPNKNPRGPNKKPAGAKKKPAGGKKGPLWAQCVCKDEVPKTEPSDVIGQLYGAILWSNSM